MNTPGLSGPFVGRTEHLATLGRALADRRCRGMVISGRTGVGKSRLAEECLAAARRDGAAVATVLASEAAGTVPLAALAHLLPAGLEMSDPVAGFAGVGERLSGRGVAAGRKMVVLVDDLPLLDAASVMLIRQLMDAGQIWLLGTMRSTRRLSALVETLCEDDAVWRVELPELSGAEVEDLLVSLLGGTVSHRTLSRLRDVRGGNPLFLRELVTGAMARGALARDGEVWELADGAVPRTARLTELITARLPVADGEARRALELLAFCEPLSVADVEQTTPGPVIADLERSGVIRVIQDERRLMVTLAHPLYGEVLRAGITQDARRPCCWPTPTGSPPREPPPPRHPPDRLVAAGRDRHRRPRPAHARGGARPARARQRAGRAAAARHPRRAPHRSPPRSCSGTRSSSSATSPARGPPTPPPTPSPRPSRTC